MFGDVWVRVCLRCQEGVRRCQGGVKLGAFAVMLSKRLLVSGTYVQNGWSIGIG